MEGKYLPAAIIIALTASIIPAAAAMITGGTDGAKAIAALKFQDGQRYAQYSHALSPELRAKSNGLAEAAQQVSPGKNGIRTLEDSGISKNRSRLDASPDRPVSQFSTFDESR